MVKKTVQDAKRNKACEHHGIPADELENDSPISFLHILLNICFDKGIILNDGRNGLINPITKSRTVDTRDPMQYCGITLASAMYKCYFPPS